MKNSYSTKVNKLSIGKKVLKTNRKDAPNAEEQESNKETTITEAAEEASAETDVKLLNV